MPEQESSQYDAISIGNDEVGYLWLTGFEIPEVFPAGGSQKTILTEYLGNFKREIQVLGAQKRPLAWTGAFYYASALARARFFESMMVKGLPVTVTWGEIKVVGTITDFTYDIYNVNAITYSVNIEPTQQEEIAQAEDLTSKDFISSSLLMDFILAAQGLLTDIKRLFALATAIQRGDVNSMLGALTNILSIVQPIAGALGVLTPTQISALIVAVNGLVYTAEKLAVEFGNLARNPDLAYPTAEMQAVASTTKILQQLLRKYADSSGTNNTTIVVDNVFAVAQRVYGTTDAWEDIAAANNLTSTRIVGPKELVLPPRQNKTKADPKNTDGAYFVVPNRSI